jgi:hypothetical protein
VFRDLSKVLCKSPSQAPALSALCPSCGVTNYFWVLRFIGQLAPKFYSSIVKLNQRRALKHAIYAAWIGDDVVRELLYAIKCAIDSADDLLAQFVPDPRCG